MGATKTEPFGVPPRKRLSGDVAPCSLMFQEDTPKDLQNKDKETECERNALITYRKRPNFLGFVMPVDQEVGGSNPPSCTSVND
jgi:hypothetical protein